MQTFVNGLNHYLRFDIAAKAAFRVADTFNVRRDAISREYNYYILNSPTQSPIRRSFSYLVTGRLDIEVMNQACQSLVGEHDFTSFTTLDEARTRSTMLKSMMSRRPPTAILIAVLALVAAVAGTATDSSEIKSVALKIMQTDWREIETYWNGSEWTSNESAKIDLSITPSTSVAFEYDGLNDSDISSGSHYKLTVEAIDEFDHIGKSMVGFSSGEK